MIDYNNIVKATQIGFQTLLNPDKNIPHKFGNCFDIIIENKPYKVLNFYVENLQYLISTGLTWPIDCIIVNNRAVIHDSRIPHNFYNDHFCNVCTPINLLPYPQRLKRERMINSGELVCHGSIEKYSFDKTPAVEKIK